MKYLYAPKTVIVKVYVNNQEPVYLHVSKTEQQKISVTITLCWIQNTAQNMKS